MVGFDFEIIRLVDSFDRNFALLKRDSLVAITPVGRKEVRTYHCVEFAACAVVISTIRLARSRLGRLGLQLTPRFQLESSCILDPAVPLNIAFGRVKSTPVKSIAAMSTLRFRG